jgi:hypothetical protein
MLPSRTGLVMVKRDASGLDNTLALLAHAPPAKPRLRPRTFERGRHQRTFRSSVLHSSSTAN